MMKTSVVRNLLFNHVVTVSNHKFSEARWRSNSTKVGRVLERSGSSERLDLSGSTVVGKGNDRVILDQDVTIVKNGMAKKRLSYFKRLLTALKDVAFIVVPSLIAIITCVIVTVVTAGLALPICIAVWMVAGAFAAVFLVASLFGACDL